MASVHPIPWGYIVAAALTMGGYLLAFVLVPRIILERREAAATLAWILAIVFLPYLGALIFYLFGRNRVRRRARKRLQVHEDFQGKIERLPPASLDTVQEKWTPATDVPARNIALVANFVTQNPCVRGNTAEVFIDTDQAYLRMEESIKKARHHVHMMSYIFRDDEAGRRFLDLLARKARDGVLVKLMVDGWGSNGLKNGFVEPLLKAGGRFARFTPVFSKRWRPNLRNHRKILVVDGRVGFTGGLNIGEEYQGRKKKFGPWRDTHLRLAGPGVRYLQEAFAEDWFFATNEDLAAPEYFPELLPSGPDLVQVVNSGPDYDYEAIYSVFITAINEAGKTLYVTTPYFVPDQAMILALKAAVWRGVDVRFLLPGRSDLWLVKLAGQSYYQELLEAGVKLYEFNRGILHAKTMVVDGVWSTVGSANMDIRSFRLNFETNVLVWGRALSGRMEQIFMSDLKDSRELTLEELALKPHSARLYEAISRVLSPVL